MTRFSRLSRNPRLALALAASLVSSAPSLTHSRPRPTPDTAQLELDLDKLSVLGSVLYLAAHPDDENTAFLAHCARGRLFRCGYLSLTRGDGGQNLIGTERGPALGLLRTQELLAARRIDGAEQMFSRAVDFGYSKTPEETLRLWDREAILSDAVWAIRKFRPDVIVTRFSPTYLRTHGHHVASAILALEAFTAAADPERFPKQLTELEPWQARRIFWNTWRPHLEGRPDDAPPLLSLDLGAFNPTLGKSYGEIAALSRSQHRCQGFGASARRGSYLDYFELLAGESPPGDDLLSGIDTTWARVAGSEKVSEAITALQTAFDRSSPSAVVPLLLGVHQLLDAMPAGYWVDVKRRDVEGLVRDAAGLWIEAIGDRHDVVAGSDLIVTTSVIDRGTADGLVLERVEVTYGRAKGMEPVALAGDEPHVTGLAITIPADVRTSEPYWLVRPIDSAIYHVDERELIGRPESSPALLARFTFALGSAPKRTITFVEPVSFRWTDPVRGELYRDVAILPQLTVALDDDVYLFTDEMPHEVTVKVTNHGSPVTASIHLELPEGFRLVKQLTPIALAAGEQRPLTVEVEALGGGGGSSSVGTLSAAVSPIGGNARFDRRLTRIEYDHIPVQTMYAAATAKLVRTELGPTDRRIGYIMGSGDEVPDALRQAGFSVELLSDEMLESGELEAYDTIVTGIRAMNRRPRLEQLQPRLLDYVADGGTLVMQYNTSHRLVTQALGPKPMKLGRDRITDQTAPLRIIDRDHPLVNHPNRITAADFDGWVQERGLYFVSEWDPSYQPLLAGNDPGEEETSGALLCAEHGDGAFVYTGLSFFRQLPAGVPGAFRLFANLLAAGSEKRRPH